MSYIVTTTRTSYYRGVPGSSALTTVPRTVATFEEARDAAKDIIIDGPSRNRVDSFIFDTYHLREPGGLIGPLPDGSVIEVRAA
jgi:hypothetical protein